MAHKSEKISTPGAWYWVWQQGYQVAYRKGVSRNEVAATYVQDLTHNTKDTIYVVGEKEPTGHMFTVTDI